MRLQSYAPQQNTTAVHVGWTHKRGGGILTLIPTFITLQHQITGYYFVHVQLLVGTCSMLHMLNVYLPPNLPHVVDLWWSVLVTVD